MTSEAQLQQQFIQESEEPGDDQLRQVLAQSVLETRHDPTETPHTASSVPAAPVQQEVSQAPTQPDPPTMMTPEEMSQARETLRVVSDEFVQLSCKMVHAVNYTHKDMLRMQALQLIAFECRQKIGIAPETPAPTPEEPQDSSRASAPKRRADEQSGREQGVKLWFVEARHPSREREALPNRLANCPSDSIASIFNKGVEDLSSSVPSSAGITPTSIRSTFQGSATALPTDQFMQELSVSPSGTQVLILSDPRRAAMIGDIKEKLKRTQSSKSAPPPKGTDATARSTPSSLEELD